MKKNQINQEQPAFDAGGQINEASSAVNRAQEKLADVQSKGKVI